MGCSNLLRVGVTILVTLCSQNQSWADNDSSSEADRIYGVNPRARMKMPTIQEHESGAPLTPSDRKRLLEIQNLRLKLGVDEALVSNSLINNPILNTMISKQGPDVYYVLLWNEVALDLLSIDHTKVGSSELPEGFYREQFGPPRASRALAMVHLAIFEAVNTITGDFASYRPATGKSIKELVLEDLNTPTRGAGVPFNSGTIDESNLNATNATVSAAISYAAYDMLKELYPKKHTLVDAIMIKVLASISPNANSAEARKLGVAIGHSVARKVIALRKNDRSEDTGPNADCNGAQDSLCREPRFKFFAPRPPSEAIKYQPDDVSRPLLQLGGVWGNVTPFEASNGKLIHLKAGSAHDYVIDLGPTKKIEPPIEGSPEFELALTGSKSPPSIDNPHVKDGPKVSSKYGVWRYGGSGTSEGAAGTQLPSGTSEGPVFATQTERTEGADDETSQEFQGNFWGYDATALLCAPPRLYNMMATAFALTDENPNVDKTNSAVKMARYLALVNLALADAGIASWKAKYAFFRDRPVNFIRYRDPNRVVTVAGMPSKAATWTPFGQVASNFSASNTTPPFPSYPSGHAAFGGALFEVMRKVYEISPHTPLPFHFVSDEYNGLNVGADGRPRKYKNILFTSLDAAEWENAESRVWLGIHFQYDADDGVALGNKVGDNLVANQLAPKSP